MLNLAKAINASEIAQVVSYFYQFERSYFHLEYLGKARGDLLATFTGYTVVLPRSDHFYF